MANEPYSSADLYAGRFSADDHRRREVFWQVLCAECLQRYVPEEGVAVDVGAGDGLLIRHLRARRRIAVDASTRVRALEGEGIEVRVAPADSFASGFEGEADTVILSNLLEHLPSREAVLEVLRECKRALRQDGLLVILQPNIRYVGGAYWDYFDHLIPLTERSVTEALHLTDYEVLECRPRFLPYTATSFRAISPSWMAVIVRFYLRIPLLWHLFGGQSLIVARPRQRSRGTHDVE